MHARRKTLLWLVSGFFLVLVITTLIVLSSLLDGKRLKQLARDTARQEWSRDLTIGEIELKLFPFPQLHAKNVMLSNPIWARDKYLIEASDMQVNFALRPLLSGKIEVNSLAFVGLKANFNVANDGRRSWEFPSPSAASSFTVVVSSLNAKNSRLRFRHAEDAPLTWNVQTLSVTSQSELRDVSFDMHLERDQHVLQLTGKVDDLTEFGQAGAVSNGQVQFKSGLASATLRGKLPLDLALTDYDLIAHIDAPSLHEFFGFFDLKYPLPAPLQADVVLRTVSRKTNFTDLVLKFGQINLSGAGEVDLSNKTPSFSAHLQADHVDMRQPFFDDGVMVVAAGTATAPQTHDGIPWHLLLALRGWQAKLEVNIALLDLPGGLEVTDANAEISLSDERLSANKFYAKLLDGTVAGDAAFDARRKAVQLNLEMEDITLAQLFKQYGSNLKISGGKIKLNAKVNAVGSRIKDLFETLTGPVDIRVGTASIFAPNAGKAEFWFTGIFSAKNADRVNLACLSARLPFRAGLADGIAIVGARSDVSQLLTSGSVNLRTQRLNLNGKVRARSGINLGISTFANEVKIAGPLASPQMSLDKSAATSVIAKIGAAIFTGGLSVVATSLWNGANPASDPCQQVFSNKARAAATQAKKR